MRLVTIHRINIGPYSCAYRSNTTTTYTPSGATTKQQQYLVQKSAYFDCTKNRPPVCYLSHQAYHSPCRDLWYRLQQASTSGEPYNRSAHIRFSQGLHCREIRVGERSNFVSRLASLLATYLLCTVPPTVNQSTVISLYHTLYCSHAVLVNGNFRGSCGLSDSFVEVPWFATGSSQSTCART